MLRRFEKGMHKPVPTELSWEEKNPTNYIYRESEAIFFLTEKIS